MSPATAIGRRCVRDAARRVSAGPVGVMLGVVLGLVLGVGVAPATVVASPDAATSVDADAMTATLHPGWNMVGWLGPPTPVADLFDAIPSLGRVALWDAAGQRYRSRARTGIRPDGMGQLTAGMGLWLWLGGDAPVEWSRPVSAGGAPLSLHPGWNLVGWAGEDGAAAGALLPRFGASLTGAARWDAERQGYAHYRPGAPDPAGTLDDLRRGDALWVELDHRFWLWQPGAVLVVSGPVPEATVTSVRGELSRLRSFFSERFGTGPVDYAVHLAGDDESAAAAARGLPGGGSSRVCAAASSELGVFVLNASCPGAHTYALDSNYLRTAIERLAPWASLPPSEEGYGRRGPDWLVHAIRSYAGDAYNVTSGLGTWDEIRARQGRVVHRLDRSLASLGSWRELTSAEHEGARALVLFAGEWLVTRAGEPALVDYYRQLPATANWREAFETAFGITADGFYREFEAYRATIASVFSPRQVRGWLRDGDGNPAPGAHVIAAPNERRWEDATRTADDGSFALEVVDGRYDIYLSLAATSCGLEHVAVLVVVGADVTDLELRLPGGSSCGPA